MAYTINHFAISHKGNHDIYEDRALCMGPKQANWANRGYLFAVADGISGEKQASTAADLAISVLKDNYFKQNLVRQQSLVDHLISAVERANQEVYKKSIESKAFNGMGSTLSAILFLDERVYVAHVGDSRIYYLGNNQIKQLTRDHLDSQGCLTEFIGKENGLNIHRTETPFEDGDQFLLCTDGLKVPPERILRIARRNNNLKEASQDLVQQAIHNGSLDDITLILLEIESD